MSIADKIEKKNKVIQPKSSGVSADDRPLPRPTKAEETEPQKPAVSEKSVFTPVDGEPPARLQVDIPESLLMALEEWVADEKRTARSKRKRTSKNELVTSMIEKSMIARGYYKRRTES
tara:strand:- start:269 stop:622 length:354 start_codon:yes stop_codon:yes gene_type:complete